LEKKGKSSILAGNQTEIPRTTSPWRSHYTDYAIPAPLIAGVKYVGIFPHRIVKKQNVPEVGSVSVVG
jgi:hypothetical protein